MATRIKVAKVMMMVAKVVDAAMMKVAAEKVDEGVVRTEKLKKVVRVVVKAAKTN